MGIRSAAGRSTPIPHSAIGDIMLKTISRELADRRFIIARLDIDRGYFSLTGELYEPRGTWSGKARHRNGRDFDAGGQITEDLLRAFPDLAAFARMHLSDAATGE